MSSHRLHIKDLSIVELRKFLAENEFPSYRADQIFDAVYQQGVGSFENIASLPELLRELLGNTFSFESVAVEKLQEAGDGTKKALMTLHDGRAVETVLIPSELLSDDGEPKRRTICVSTQVGCPLNCAFCATASLKVKRNLRPAEILDQFFAMQRLVDRRITNLVFMGMGEPMLNYDNVMKSVDILTHGKKPLLGSKRITLSTAGVIPGIIRLADEKRTIKLAISLHATTNGLRKELMPIARKYDLQQLGEAVEYYYRKTRIPITYEYILFDGLNDSMSDVRRLAKLCRRVPSKVNVIPFHEIDFTNPEGISAQLRPTTKEKFYTFLQELKNQGTVVMIRSSSGLEIDAACGQLAFSSAPPDASPKLYLEAI